MDKGIDKIETEFTAFAKTIDFLDKQFDNGTISETFYFKRRKSLVRDQEIIIRDLQDILEQNDAKEVSVVLDRVKSGAKDDDIEKEMKNTQKAGNTKSWGETFTQAVNKEKGSIMQVALKAALKVAGFLL